MIDDAAPTPDRRLARAAPDGAARGERRAPDARGAARARLGVVGVTVEIDDERDADAAGRLVLAHDDRPRGARSSASARAGPESPGMYGRTARTVSPRAGEWRRSSATAARRAAL